MRADVRRIRERAAVVARSYDLYREWCSAARVMPGRDAAYIPRPSELRGWQGPVLLVEGWDRNRTPAELTRWHEALAPLTPIRTGLPGMPTEDRRG